MKKITDEQWNNSLEEFFYHVTAAGYTLEEAYADQISYLARNGIDGFPERCRDEHLATLHDLLIHAGEYLGEL